MICLDTNMVISILNGRIPSLRHRVEEQARAGNQVGLPVLVIFEMRYGIEGSNQRALLSLMCAKPLDCVMARPLRVGRSPL